MQTLSEKKLLHFIDEHTSAYNDLWKFFSSHKNTFDLHILQELITSQYQMRGIIPRMIDTEGTLFYAEIKSSSSDTLLLFMHLSPTAPLSFFPLLASLLALDAYQATTSTLPATIKWLINIAAAAPNVQDETLLQADGCICYVSSLDDTFTQMALGTKGYLCVELAVHTAHTTLPSSYGTTAPNAAWRLLWALNTLKDAREEVLIKGFYDTLEPFEDEAIDLLRTLPDTAAALAQQWQVPQLLMGLNGMQQQYTHLLTPTCSINAISSGVPNAQQPIHPLAWSLQTMPFQARAQIDFYLTPGQDPQTLFTSLQQHLEQEGFPDVQIRLLAAHPPLYTPISHPFVTRLQQATKKTYELAPPMLPLLPITLPCLPFQQIQKTPFVIMLQHLEDERLHNQAQQIATNTGYSKQLVLLLEHYNPVNMSTSTSI